MFAIKKVKVSRPCRVRIYESLKHMLLDASRPVYLPPTPSKIIILDLLLTDAAVMNGEWICSPSPLVTTPYNDMVMLVEPPAMVKLTTVEVESKEKTEEFQPTPAEPWPSGRRPDYLDRPANREQNDQKSDR